MRTIMIFVACLSALAAAESTEDPDQWIQLFNGKDLDGWQVKIAGYELGDNYADTFRVEDGVLRVAYDGYEEFGGRFGHLFCDRELSDHYRLRAEYRFVGEQVPGGPGWAWRNSGLMIHGQSAESMGKDQSFPVSIEVQLLGGRAEGERTNANLCTPGTLVVMNGELDRRHCIDSSSQTCRGDEWVTVEVVVDGNTVTHIVEGVPVLTYTDPQLDPADADAAKLLAAGSAVPLTGGTLSLQSESHAIEFRKVELLETPPPPPPAGLTMRSAGDVPIAVVKVLAEHLGMDLAESRELIHHTPSCLGDGLTPEKLAALKAALIAAGADVE